MENSRKFLLFCPDISGHRHLYSRRLIDYLCDRGYDVVVATAGRTVSISGLGRMLYESFAVDWGTSLEENLKVEFVDLKERAGVVGSFKQLGQVAGEYACTDVIHVDADCFRWPLAFSKYIDTKVQHHVLLICTEFIDWKRKVSFIRESWRALKVLTKGHARGLFLANREYGVQRLPRISEYLIKRICNRSSAINVITTDERLSNPSGDELHYIPELGTSHWECSSEEQAMDPMSARILGEVKQFCSEHADKRVICMLGDLESRKGYDLILQLCASEKDTVCVRVGRTKPTYRTTWESIDAKECLIQERRIYEFDSYVPSWDLFKSLMSLQRVVILPYREFYRTSGVFIDALVSGKPVIVPETGLMGWRTREYSLGAVFKGDSLVSLREALQTCTDSLDDYSANAHQYAQKLEKGNFYERLDDVFRLHLR